MRLEFDKYPIDQKLEQIYNSLSQSKCILLKAQTGAGKTTRLPPYLISKSEDRVLVLEPRRLAAKLSALRCAETLDVALGEVVGHHIRFDKKLSDQTRLLFITEGLFLSYLQADPTLSQYNTIILDEFHERSIHTDTALCLIRKLQASTRPDLKLIIMSATLDTQELESYLEKPTVFNISGRVFPLIIEYHELEIKQAIINMIEDPRCPKNILVFLPGLAAIRKLQTELKDQIDDEIKVVALHSSLSKQEQDIAFKGKQRKVILSTNIAETSLTIPYITGVIDTGLERRASFAPWSGMPLLQLEKISKASATQRAGRAGRIQEGVVYRVYNENNYSQRENFTPAEIKRIDLTHYILNLINQGYNISQLHWFESPNEKNLENAISLLHTLGLLKNNQITKSARFISLLPLHPRLGTMVYSAKDDPNFNDVLLAVCLLSEGMILSRKVQFFTDDDQENCDLCINLDLFKAYYHKMQELSDYKFHLIDLKTYKRVFELYNLLTQKLKINKKLQTTKMNPSHLSKALLAGYPDRVAMRRKLTKNSHNQANYNLCMGRGGKLTFNSSLITTKPECIIVLDALEDPKVNASVGTSIITASKVSIDLLRSLQSPLLYTNKESYFNNKKGTLTLTTTTKYGNLTLASHTEQPITPVGDNLIQLIHSNWPWPFTDDLELQHYHKRVKLLNDANIEHSCPYFTGEMFELLLESSIEKTTNYQELKNTGLKKIIRNQLSAQDQYLLDTKTPLSIILSNNKEFKIDYTEEIPFIEARIQDLFGVEDHPFIANNTVALSIKLLSPANKAIQKSSDLKVLWSTSWQLLRADLRSRYPKHYWPDRPAQAKPIRMKKDVSND